LLFFIIGPILAFDVKIMAFIHHLLKNNLSNIKNFSRVGISDIFSLFIKRLNHFPAAAGLKRRGFK